MMSTEEHAPALVQDINNDPIEVEEKVRQTLPLKNLPFCKFNKFIFTTPIFYPKVPFNWPSQCLLPDWVKPPDFSESPKSVWWLEITEGHNPASRILLDR